MINAVPSSDNHTKNDRWIAEYSFKIKNDDAREILESLRPNIISDVVRLWLNVTTPDARILGPADGPIEQVSFTRRRDLRRFISNWGGRAIAPSAARGEQ
jgi:hypothetical protein